MATTTLTDRVPAWPPPEARTRLDRYLGKPLAFLLTAAILLALFGWTFVANPDRVAPTKDPAYYTWRTEAFITEDPERLLEIEGAFNMFSAGYRVSAPVLGGFLRRVPAIGTLRVTSFLMVVLPVLTCLLLAGFAYRRRPDPLIFHAVALGSASLFLTPPFVGYLDNVLCLFWLAAALPFIDRMRYSWPARAAFCLFLVLAGLTHPTTLLIFCVVLGAMSAWRLLFRKFRLRSVIADDGPMLVTGFMSVVITYAIWKVGVWGPSASLGDAALPPPYGSDFFVDRLMLWVRAMRPALNGPLFLIGVAGLLAAHFRSRRVPEEIPAGYTTKTSPLGEDELTRVGLVWLAPLAGIFGFVGGLTYPYYRFFNTTLAWVLLVGLGIYFAARFFIGAGARNKIAYLGLIALAAVVVTNFTHGFKTSGWNNARGGWLGADERMDLDALRAALEEEDPDRPVVFVIDQDDRDFQIWGFTKLSGNTSRYGLPHGQIDQAYLYLGSLENYLAGEPTLVGQETYDDLSPALLEDATTGIEATGEEPLVVVAAIFNETGANAAVATATTGNRPFVGDAGAEVWVVQDGAVTTWPDGDSLPGEPEPDEGGLLHLAVLLGGLVLLLLPGLFAWHYFLPDGKFSDGVGLVPALSAALLITVGTLVSGVTQAPFTTTVAFVSAGIATGLGIFLFRGIHRGSSPPERAVLQP